MNLTRQQISALTDTELNRAMIWLYPTDGRVWTDGFFYYCSSRGGLAHLLDWDLTMPLAVENNVSTINESGNCWAGTDAMAGDGLLYMENDVINKNPLRAICECLVLTALEQKK